jgi:hypothetical protein
MNKIKEEKCFVIWVIYISVLFYLVAASLLIFHLSITPASLIKIANGDGLFMEELSASFSGRKANNKNDASSSHN